MRALPAYPGVGGADFSRAFAFELARTHRARGHARCRTDCMLQRAVPFQQSVRALRGVVVGMVAATALIGLVVVAASRIGTPPRITAYAPPGAGGDWSESTFLASPANGGASDGAGELRNEAAPLSAPAAPPAPPEASPAPPQIPFQFSLSFVEPETGGSPPAPAGITPPVEEQAAATVATEPAAEQQLAEPATPEPSVEVGAACGAVLCGRGEVCCDPSCGICTDPGGTCSHAVCNALPWSVSVTCGPNTCNVGQVCCNPSCGICTRLGESCDSRTCGWDTTIPDSVLCGPNTCNVGEVCCNASCGICTRPGQSCDQTQCAWGGMSIPFSVTCGMSTCNVGEVCCNPSCGICARPGERCSTEVCGW